MIHTPPEREAPLVSGACSEDQINRIVSKYAGLNVLEKVQLRTRLKRCPYNWLAAHCPDEGSVLDVGCGYGHFGWFLYFNPKNLEYLGIDVDERKVEIARASMGWKAGKHQKYPSFFSGDLFDQPSLDRLFDTIFLLDVIYLIPWDMQKKMLLWAFEHLKAPRPGYQPRLVIKVHTDLTGKITLYSKIHEWIMGVILRKTKSSGTRSGNRRAEDYGCLAESKEFRMDIENLGERGFLFVFKQNK